MKPTRLRLLKYLEEKQIATSQELSWALQVTPADVRHHISALLDDGSIQIIGEREPQGPGRPARLFSLSNKQKSDNLLLLLETLLIEMSSEKLSNESTNRFRSIANRLMATSHIPENLTQRLYLAIKRLNELNYHARWEAQKENPKIILGNCPYSAIIHNRPEICFIDKFLIEGLLSTRVDQETKLLRDNRGYATCVFNIGRKV